MKGNSYFIKVGDTRVQISTINSYSLVGILTYLKRKREI